MNRNIDNLGRIVIPKEMRKKLELNNGDEVKIELKGNVVIVSNPTLLDPFEEYLSNLAKDNEEVEINHIIYMYRELRK